MFKRTKTSIGLDIGTHSIKMVVLGHTPEGVSVSHYAIKELSPETMGEKGDSGVIAEKIKELFQEENIKSKKVTIGVSGAQVAMRCISFPPMPKKELKEATRWAARKFISFPIEGAIVDYQFIGETVEQGETKHNLMVAIAGGEFIGNQLSLVKDAGLEAVGMGPSPHALWYCMQLIPETTEGVIALIDIGYTRTSISLVKDNRLQLTREINTAGKAFSEAIKEAAALDIEEVEEIKKKWGIPREEDVEVPEGHISLQKILFAMRPLLEKLLSEIKQSFDFYKTRFNKEAKIRRVFLSGGGARLKGLKKYIADQLDAEIELLAPFRDIPPIFTTAIGLALGRAEGINLLPEQNRRGRKIALRKYSSVAFAFLAFLVLFGIYFKMDEALIRHRKELALKEADFAGLQSAEIGFVQPEGTKNEMDQQQILFPEVVMKQLPWIEILKEISHITPEKMTLTSLSMQTKDNIKELRLEGVTFGEDAKIVGTIVEIINDLEGSPFFSHVRLTSSKKNTEYNKPGAEFELVCQVTAGD